MRKTKQIVLERTKLGTNKLEVEISNVLKIVKPDESKGDYFLDQLQAHYDVNRWMNRQKNLIAYIDRDITTGSHLLVLHSMVPDNEVEPLYLTYYDAEEDVKKELPELNKHQWYYVGAFERDVKDKINRRLCIGFFEDQYVCVDSETEDLYLSGCSFNISVWPFGERIKTQPMSVQEIEEKLGMEPGTLIIKQ